MLTPLPPVAVVIGFVDAINRGDVNRPVALMSADHRLQVLREPALAGLPDQEERQLKVIWRATVRDGLLALWQVIEDTPEQRASLGPPHD